ncbi:hypothetical protein NFI96_029052 [Prochilodus magdalenae]|nr:hypothetical protein NFI96_029052 [Prochilodus magdalenae]
MERLLLNHLRPQVHHAEDPLQFAYREKVGVEDAILYLLHRAHSNLDKGGGAVRVMFFDFSNDVLQLLEISNPTTCPLDPIPSTLLQSISLDLLPFISSLMNCSLSSGHVPQAFEPARVVPILKKPSLDSSDISSYRPVSLLSFLSKILERAVYNQICPGSQMVE